MSTFKVLVVYQIIIIKDFLHNKPVNMTEYSILIQLPLAETRWLNAGIVFVRSMFFCFWKMFFVMWTTFALESSIYFCQLKNVLFTSINVQITYCHERWAMVIFFVCVYVRVLIVCLSTKYFMNNLTDFN